MNTCKTCGTPTDNEKFCSSKCSALSNGVLGRKERLRKSKEAYKLSKKRCPCCGKPIPYELRRNKFCNHSCASTTNNKGVRRHGNQASICIACGKKNSDSKAKYCSSSCFHQHQYEKYISSWKSGTETGLSGEAVSRHIKRYLIETRGWKCEICGWEGKSPYTDKAPLTIHHIDGNWKNNSEKNLKILCPNHHALTENYGARNKGSGRECRNKWREQNAGVA